MIALAALLLAVLPDAPMPQTPVFARPFALNVAAYERWKLSQMQSSSGYRESTVILSLDYRLAKSRVRVGVSGAAVINEQGRVTWNTSAGVNVKLLTWGRRIQ